VTTEIDQQAAASTIDVLLYDWLNEPAEDLFERKFSVYYTHTFPAVVRYLTRRVTSTSLDVDVESVAQDSLIKFFDVVGKSRRVAGADLGEAIASLRPGFPDAFHRKRVLLWKELVDAFRQRALTFPEMASRRLAQFHDAIRAINGEIPTLQRQGRTFLDESYERLVREINVSGAMQGPACSADSDEVAESLRRTSELLKILADVEPTTAGMSNEVCPFLDRTSLITSLLPKIRIHTNSFLFEIAKNRLLDELRRHRARAPRTLEKSAAALGELEADVTTDRSVTSVPELAAVAALREPQPEDLTDDCLGDSGMSLPRGTVLDIRLRALDDEEGETYSSTDAYPDARTPEDAYATHEIFEKFLFVLGAPVRRASEEMEHALTQRARNDASKRLDKERLKYRQLEAILIGIAEGASQEEMAERLGLTRNQIKYAVEQAREELAKLLSADTSSAQHFSRR